MIIKIINSRKLKSEAVIAAAATIANTKAFINSCFASCKY